MKHRTFTAIALSGAISLGLTACGPTVAHAAGPGHCPPGLAKKGCVPPGQAKKYSIGQPLNTYYTVIRDYDRYSLNRPPEGYFYARVDQDVLLVAEATRKVADLVVILDALSN